MKASTEELNSIFLNIKGKIAWDVRIGYGSFITMNFGDPYLDVLDVFIDDPRRHRLATIYGDWHLWIYCANWSICKNGTILANSDDKRKKWRGLPNF